MRLVLGLTPNPIEFSKEGSGGPFAYLKDVGPRRMAVRAGTAIGIADNEAPSVPVTLNNDKRKVTAIARRPLRVAADIYDDDDRLTFSGTVSSVELGDVVVWEIDA